MIYSEIQKFITDFDSFYPKEDRQKLLLPFRNYVQHKLATKKHLRLNFICTHNSRRSHLAQVWAQTMVIHFKLKDVYCFSGGTEETALNLNIVEVLESSGFKIEVLAQTQNSVYNIKFADNVHPVIGFSKKYDALFNPKTKFAAIMTCSEADQNCPNVIGAENRFPLNYEDPKLFDNTPLEMAKYEERNQQIAQEMYWVFKP
jgi:arsenate reductase (thioredoxin)